MTGKPLELEYLARRSAMSATFWEYLAKTRPSWTAVKNDLGNIAIYTEAGEYIGFVDPVSSEILLAPGYCDEWGPFPD